MKVPLIAEERLARRIKERLFRPDARRCRAACSPRSCCL